MSWFLGYKLLKPKMFLFPSLVCVVWCAAILVSSIIATPSLMLLLLLLSFNQYDILNCKMHLPFFCWQMQLVWGLQLHRRHRNHPWHVSPWPLVLLGTLISRSQSGNVTLVLSPIHLHFKNVSLVTLLASSLQLWPQLLPFPQVRTYSHASVHTWLP